MPDQPYSGEQPPPLPGQAGPFQGQRQADWNQQNRQYQPPPPPSAARNVFLPTCLAAGCATLVAPILILVGFLFVVGLLVNDNLSDASSALDSYSGASTMFREKLIRAGDKERGTIAIISIQGEITGNGSSLEGTGTLAQVAEQLRAAGEDDAVRAVILQIDSPGGGLTPSDILHDEVMKLKKKDKKVVTWAGGLVASGGYYIAVASDGIMASPTASVGSIGVIMKRFQVDGLMKMLGLKSDPIMAGASKDLGSPFREMTPEERAVLQESVDDAHKRFIRLVAEGRKMSEADVTKLADGKIFTADAAKENGLIDKIGYIDEAIAWTEELAGRDNMRIVSYRRIFTFADFLSSAEHAAARVSSTLSDASVRHPHLASEWNGE